MQYDVFCLRKCFITDPERFTESEDDNSFEEVNIQTWLSKPGVIGKFECDEIKDNQTRYPGYVSIFASK